MISEDFKRATIMPSQIKDYLQSAHQLDRDAFVERHPHAVLVQRSDSNATDPRNEYRSTLKMRIDPKTKEVRVEPIPPSPLDRVIELTKTAADSFPEKVLVGRTETNDIALADLTVSKHHAFFKADEDAGRVLLTDTGSTNGTQVNGQPLPARQSRYLHDGDQLSFGDVRFIFFSAEAFFDLLGSLSVLL